MGYNYDQYVKLPHTFPNSSKLQCYKKSYDTYLLRVCSHIECAVVTEQNTIINLRNKDNINK